MKIKVIHQWRDWLLECVGGGQYAWLNIAAAQGHKKAAENRDLKFRGWRRQGRIDGQLPEIMSF
jgi:hypothetical protein